MFAIQEKSPWAGASGIATFLPAVPTPKQDRYDDCRYLGPLSDGTGPPGAHNESVP